MPRKPKTLLKDTHPDIAAQLIDKSLLQTLGTGSDKSVEWECEHGHRWFAKVVSRTNAKNKTGCPVCAGKKVIPGINDLATLRPDIASTAVDAEACRHLSLYSNKKLKWKCEHGHVWEAPVYRRTKSGCGCPYCSGRLPIVGENDLATTHPDIASQLTDKALAEKLKAGSMHKVEWVCDHGHIWSESPYARTHMGSGCPYCSNHRVIEGENDMFTTHPELAAQLVNPDDAKKVSFGTDKKLLWRCRNDPRHMWWSTPSNRSRVTCPYCSNKRVLIGDNDLATTHPDIAAQLADPALATQLTAGSGRKVEWVCDQGHHWMTTVWRRAQSPNPTGCPICAAAGVSEKEKDVAKIVRRLLPNRTIWENDRQALNGQELDIVIPDLRIAIEFNGCVWHSSKFKPDAKYHLKKLRAAQAAGYTLFQIWEDDWDDRRDIVIRALAHKLHALDRLPDILDDFDPTMIERIGARNLRTARIDGKQAAIFLDANHIQGHVIATRHYALLDDQNRIRAVMSLRSPRNNARMHRRPGEWEIQRYATRGCVAGGFGKLLEYAKRDLYAQGIELRRWISLSSNDISDGNLYERCGFTRDGEVTPNYYYVGNSTGWRRMPKESYQRRRFRNDPELIWDESWTERQAAEANQLYRVYDSGKVRWIKNVD